MGPLSIILIISGVVLAVFIFMLVLWKWGMLDFTDEYHYLHEQHRYKMMMVDKMKRSVDAYEKSKESEK